MQQETNERLLNEMEGADSAKDGSSASSSKASTPTSAGPKKGWFNWSWWNCFLQKSRFFIHIQMYACRCAIEVDNPIITHFISKCLFSLLIQEVMFFLIKPSTISLHWRKYFYVLYTNSFILLLKPFKALHITNELL